MDRFELLGIFILVFYVFAAIVVIAPIIYAIVRKKWEIILSEAIILTVLAALIFVLETGVLEVDQHVTTQEYLSDLSFSQNKHVGIDKEGVLLLLGYPDGYRDAEGVYQAFPYDKRVEAQAKLMEEDVVVWVYTGYKRPDPADPYRMTVTFDENGETVDARLEMIPGG